MRKADVFKRTSIEIVRHLMYKFGIYNFILNRRTKKDRSAVDHLKSDELKSRFSSIYALGTWQTGGGAVPLSGHGSSVKATTVLRDALPSLLNDLKAKTILDIGCGDFTWMQLVTLDQHYTGVDVVDSVIARNTSNFSNERREFRVADARIDPLPKVDVVFCREMIFHIGFDDIRRVFKNILTTECKYLMLTSDRQTLFNSDMPSGDYRFLNLEKAPFRFPPPDRVVDDSGYVAGRMMCVWDIGRVEAPIRRFIG